MGVVEGVVACLVRGAADLVDALAGGADMVVEESGLTWLLTSGLAAGQEAVIRQASMRRSMKYWEGVAGPPTLMVGSLRRSRCSSRACRASWESISRSLSGLVAAVSRR